MDRKRIIFIIVLALIAGAGFLVVMSINNKYSNKLPMLNTDYALVQDKGLDYLEEAQTDSGGFTTYACKEDQECVEEPVQFMSTFVGHSLSLLNESRANNIKEKINTYLLENKEEIDGTSVWRVWEKGSELYQFIPPDIDVTACAGATLIKNKVQFQQNLQALDSISSSGNGYRTYLVNSIAHSRLIRDNDIDCVANANLLLYYTLNGQQPKEICDYVNSMLSNPNSKSCSVYYKDDLSLLYSASRAYYEGADCLTESVASIKNQVLSLHNQESNWGNELNNALAALALINIDYEGPELDSVIARIANTQQADGSWPAQRFFIDPVQLKNYQSQALTTALSIEAIYRHQHSKP